MLVWCLLHLPAVHKYNSILCEFWFMCFTDNLGLTLTAYQILHFTAFFTNTAEYMKYYPHIYSFLDPDFSLDMQYRVFVTAGWQKAKWLSMFALHGFHKHQLQLLQCHTKTMDCFIYEHMPVETSIILVVTKLYRRGELEMNLEPSGLEWAVTI